METTALNTDFKIQNKLGVGGTAEVYLATSSNYPKPVALKIPLPDSDRREFCHLAKREEKLIGHLNFPGLVKLHQINTKENPNIVLEYCSGITLEDYKSDNFQAIANILSAVALNLEYLKLVGIVHGDFKPENIFLPENIDFNHLFILKFSDFSLGRHITEPESDRAGLGTLGYTAPETISENKTDFRSDIFALGIIAFQLYSGKHPFCENFSDPVKVNSEIQENEPRDLVDLCPALPEELVTLIYSMLSKNPDRRPASGWEICKKLEENGATYPYQKVLQPKYLFNFKTTYEDLLEYIVLNNKQLEDLNYKSNRERETLRLLLSYNYIRGNLFYNGTQFEFSNDILFPKRLVQKYLNDFSTIGYKEKKQEIINAVENFAEQHTQRTELEYSRYYYDLLLHLINPKTIKKTAAKILATTKINAYAKKASLAILVGDRFLAEDSAFQAASSLIKDKKFNSALKILNSTIRYLMLTGDNFEARNLIKLKGNLFKDQGEIEKAEKTFLQLVSLYKDHDVDSLLAESYKELGNIYKFKQKFNNGIEALDKALEIYQELDDELEISHTYNNIGNINWVASKYKAAISSYLKALRIQRRLDVKEDIASTITNLGSIYAMTGKFKRALTLFDISLKFKKEIGNLGEIARTLNNLGYLHHIMNNNDKAIEALQESLDINRKIGSKKEILINMDNLIAMMFISGDIKKTIILLKEGLELADELDDVPNKAVFNIFMGSVLTRLGKIDDALKYYDSAEELIADTDDKINNILLCTERGSTFYLAGDINSAKTIVEEALTISENISEQNYKVGLLLLRYKITSDPKDFDTALAIIEKLDLKREKFLLYRLKLAIDLKEKSDSVQESYDLLKSEINHIENDIELTDTFLILADYHYKNNNFENSLSIIDKAQQRIKDQNLSFEHIRAKALSGQIKFIQNDYEGCFADFKNALNVAKEIAGNISDVNLRNCFQSKPIIGFLVKNIKEFSQKIAKK